MFSSGMMCAYTRLRPTPGTRPVAPSGGTPNAKSVISKVWLVDEEKNSFGSFYLWETKAAMEAFMHSDLVAAVVRRPFVKNVSSVDYTVKRNCIKNYPGAFAFAVGKNK